jgi:hypothetical protein
MSAGSSTMGPAGLSVSHSVSRDSRRSASRRLESVGPGRTWGERRGWNGSDPPDSVLTALARDVADLTLPAADSEGSGSGCPSGSGAGPGGGPTPGGGLGTSSGGSGWGSSCGTGSDMAMFAGPASGLGGRHGPGVIAVPGGWGGSSSYRKTRGGASV